MSWTKRRTEAETLAFLSRVSSLCGELGGSVSTELAMMVAEGRYADVIDFKIDYASISVHDAIYARQIQALYSKLGFLNLSIDKASVAYKTFSEMERSCRETNERFRVGRPNGRVASVLHGAQCKISTILGDLPGLDAFNFAFGPGASTSVKMAEACFRSKLSAKLECSNELAQQVGPFLEEVPWLVAHHSFGLLNDEATEAFYASDKPMSATLNIAPGKLQFVPKNAKTYRSIVIEPTLNGFFQKGVGEYIKDRLQRFGVDLRSQERNRNLARKGSLDGTLATIDLKSASDTVSYGLVLDLLPWDWFDLLSNCRTGTVTHNGNRIPLEKFSSMGNGFTFELESLIFYALALAVCDRLRVSYEDVSVYGDDIIVPVECVPVLQEVLSYCGFFVNTEKSFWSGPFRESCGADWLHGIDIRPFYWKEHLSDRYLYLFHNWAVRHCEAELASLALSEPCLAPRLFGPNGYGDGHLIGSYTLRRNRSMRRNAYEGGYFDSYSLKPMRLNKALPGDWLVPVYSVYTRSGALDPTDPDVVRGSRGYAKVSIYTLKASVF